MRVALAAAAVGLALSASAMAQNTGATITDGDAQFQYTSSGTGTLPTSSTSGGNVTMNYRITAAPVLNNTFSGNWYYRVAGDTRERHNFSATSRTLTGTNKVEWGFPVLQGAGGAAIGGLSATMGWEIFDTGDDSAALASWMCVTNNGVGPVSIDLFNAYDIDLGGNNANAFGGDAYAALDTSGGNRQWNITDTGATNGGAPWSAFFLGLGAHGAGVGGFSAINGQMTDTSVDNFIPDLNAGGLAAADNAAVMQWRLTLDPGASYCAMSWLAIAKNGATPVIPAPGSAALLAVGGLLAARRRRA